MEIKNVIICGLGAIGLTCASKLKDVCELKVLADEKRVERYKKNPPSFNGNPVLLEYITPQNTLTSAPDLIIIATKNDGLDSAIEYIKNFVGENTIIISLLNGITSEEKIAEVYGWNNILHSYFIGHSAAREGNSVTQDGTYFVVYGSPYKQNQEKVQTLKQFFEKHNIEYKIPEDIIYSQWLKYTFNVYANQLSAIMNMTFKEMWDKPDFKNTASAVIREVIEIAKKEGINHPEQLEQDALDCLKTMIPDGKTSMLQDIQAGRKTEVDIFSGEIIKRGKKYGIPTPCNQMLYSMIKALER